MENSEKADSEPIPTTDDPSPFQGKSCALCGCATPAVRCDRCNSQIFCLSCDDMYHHHPKRKFHLRKAVESIWNSSRSPRLRRRTDLPGDPSKIPIPPPRTKKRERHTIGGGRMFLKSGLELGSFGHSKVFDPKHLPTSRDFFTGQKSPASLVESNCADDISIQNVSNEPDQLYENETAVNPDANLDERSPWNTSRPNMSSPIQVSIPSNSPDIVPNGQSFGYPSKPHSQSAADLTGHSGHPVGPHPYHFHPPYPYMHPPMHPAMQPYSHSMAHLNCAQCISSSWSNLMSPHPSPYFHPMPWGSAQNTMSRGHQMPGQPGPMKHSHGDLVSYPDSNFHFPYSGGGYYHNGPPVVDPNFIKVLHEQAEMHKLKKEVTGSKSSPGVEEMDTATSPIPVENEPSSTANPAPSTEAGASAQLDVQTEDETPAEPEKPTEPWSCLHCTFINPPGIYICQVCCKTSYGNKHSKAPEEEIEISHRSRDSESPLINRDALLNSPDISGFNQAQKDTDIEMDNEIFESTDKNIPSDTSEAALKFTTETQTAPTTKTTDAQTQNILLKSIASSTDSIFPKQEMSVQTEAEAATQNCSVATDPMISSQSLESLLSGVSAPPYHNRRAGWGRGTISFSTQSLYERGRSRSPMPRSYSIEAHNLGRNSNFASEEAMHSASQAWLYTDPMYYKPHNQGLGQPLTKEDYFDGTWGSMDKLNHRVKHKKDKGKPEQIKPKFHRSLDDLKSEKRPEIIHTQELLMLQTVKEAERCGFSLEDLHVAYLNCGKENPVYWLEDNWSSMIKNIIALAAKYGEDNEENDVGVITTTEAKDALRIHQGDIWDAVTEVIENRQRKILELTVRGNFTQKQIVEALKVNEGNVELAFADLVRTSTRRHKFILSPGLSEDSEDLNMYNPVEESAVDHHRVSLSPMKAAKVVSVESKTEKKKSDFLTKLSAIRQAQSDRRKAREEKEFFRETITQDFSVESESDTGLKDKIGIASISREDSKEVEEIIQDVQAEAEVVAETESKDEVEVPVVTKSVKEGPEDNIPVDFDTNWSESQGEWIEEYSDEQWEGEGDEQWVGLGKKFQKMEKEFEEEAMQMAALWEKEELEDDVFEEESKPQPEVEVIDESDKKFDEWVKANLKVDSSEYEEEEIKEKSLAEAATDISFRDRIEQEVSHSSPLQHYPTEHDLSFKSEFESDWVDLPADEEIEKLAHDIVYEGSDAENKFDETETEIIAYEDEKKSAKFSDQGSDEDWEKVEMEEQLQEVNELDSFAFPDKEGEFDKNVEELDQGVLEREITIDRDSKVVYKNLENISAADASNVETTAIDSREQITDDDGVSGIREKLPSVEGDQPRPPVRRKSKLNSAAIEQALINQAMAQIPSDIPPVLPEKMKHKDFQQKVLDIYALPDKTAKLSPPPDVESVSNEPGITGSPPVPQKPPRLNLSPLSFNEQKSGEEEKRLEVPHKATLSKDGSPISLSFESDSNCFADSESDTEIKSHRQKNKLRKLAKYENEFEDADTDTAFKQRLEKLALEEKTDVLESNFDLELEDEDIDPAVIEPLPRMKDADFDPELPILLGGRGSRLSDLEDVNAPKAFREDTTRPLQLFKAVKRETPTSTLSRVSPVTVDQQDETSFMSRTNERFPMPVSSPTGFVPSLMDNANVQMESFITAPKLPDLTVYENQPTERYYYNEAASPEQNLTGNQLLDKKEHFDTLQQAEGLMMPMGMEQNVEQDVEPFSPAQEQDEMAFTEMEGMSAAQDYFFGRYDEIIVAPPKKKSMKTKPPATTSKFEIADSKAMSTSEIISTSKSPSQMEQSAAAVLQVKPQSELEPEPPIQTSLPNDQMQKIDNEAISASTVSNKTFPPSDMPKQPVPSEPLPFAEDYLFGCYNQVVVPTKTRNAPVVSARIPKLGELRGQKEHKSVSTPVPSPAPTPEPSEPEPSSEEPVEQVLESDESAIPPDSTSMIYDEIFHDLPPEMLYNQSFDESSIYESFQDAVEDMQDSSSITSSVVNIRPKSVHFEEPIAPVVPPRRHRPQGVQTGKSPASSGTNESYADEYLYRHYEQFTQASQAKKKLPVCSEDFRMQQGFEPTEFPCDTPLMPDEQEEDVPSSEISVDIPSKTIESSKYSSEYEFEDSEQPLDLVKHEDAKTEAMDTSRSFVLCSEDTSASVTAVSGIISPDTKQGSVATDSDIQSSENTESFEVLSFPDQCEELIVRDVEISSDFNVLKVSEESSSAATESQLNNMQSSQVSDTNSYDTSVPPNRLEMDQFVFIEPLQDIIDDSFNLYDIQESLACDLNYVDIKGNIEDECTDDSEQEWKRNEDRKNYLNASFLKSGSSKIVTKDQEENTLDKSEMSSLVESKDPLPLEDTLKTEKFIAIDQDEIKSHPDSNLEGTESEDLKETSFSEKPIEIRMENQNVTSEVIDSQPVTGSDMVEATDLDFESNDSFRTEETQLTCENVSKLEELSLKSDEIVTESIVQEVTKSVDQEVIESVDQDVIESIDQEVIESIDQEVTESVDQEVIESIDQEVIESIDQEFIESIDPNVSESIDEESIESVKSGITEPLNQEIIESVVEPHLEISLAVSKESSIISYVPGSSYLSSTQEDNLESSKESDVEQDAIAAEDSDVSEDQPLDNLEDFEALGDLSDDNVSSHSSVSTQIAVSMKVASKEVEGDESSLIFEQSENLENDGEVFVAISPPSTAVSDKLQDYDENNVEQTSESEDFQKLEEFPRTVVSADEDLDYDDSYLESKHDTIRSAELTPTPSFEEPHTERYSPEADINESDSVSKETLEDTEICVETSVLKEETFYGEQVAKTKATLRTDSELEEDILQSSFDENIDQFLLEPSDYPDALEEYEFKEDIISEDRADEILTSAANIMNDYINIGKEATELNLDYDEESKNILSEETVKDINEMKINESEDTELDMDSFMEEELPLPVMSHFYDYYQPSAKFTLLSTESIYAKYCTPGSSESGSESDVDNASEAVAQRFKDPSQIDDINLPDQSIEKREPENCLDEVILYDITDVYEAPETRYEYVAETISQDNSLHELSEERRRLEFMQNDQYNFAVAETEKSIVVQETMEIILVCRDADETVKDQESLDVKSVKSKFSTSKSCQTEDSFEEDIFFDSFDDTFTIPSYIHLPIEIQAKTPTSDISIQCELINNEDILFSQKVSSMTQIEAITLENQVVTALQEESPEVSKFDEKRLKQPELPVEEKEESSCESFEDSDSDIYIESPSSHDELDVSNKKGYLYAEVDSDTGFSSGSECGWTRKSDWKQKEFKKTSGSSVVEVEAKVQSLQITSSLSSIDKGTSDLVSACAVESSCDDSLKAEAVEEINISEKGVVSEKSEIVTEMEHSEVSQSEISAFTIPAEIIERAVTPIAIPQFPSFEEEDVIFVEIAENIEETTDDKQVEEISTTPTVEYFYGPLPKNIKIESLPDANDRFYETASEFSESLSLTFDRTESFSDSISSIPPSEEQLFCTLSTDIKETTAEGLEDESFVDTLASFKSEVDDSISEYYLLPDSAASIATSTSLAESDIFDFAQNEVSGVSLKEASVDSVYNKNDILNDFAVAEDKLPSDGKSKNDKFPCETVKQSTSEIKESLITSATKNVVHSEETDICVENRKILDSVPDLSAQECLTSESEKPTEVSIPDSAQEQQISNRYEPVIPQTKSDVPQVPSDIVRYLYYDDSITFDDDSFHTQSENLEIPPLSNEPVKPVDSTEGISGDENQNLQLDADKLGKPANEICALPIESVSQTKEISTLSANVPETEFGLCDELVKQNKLVIEELKELKTAPESNIPKDNLPYITEKVTDIEATSSVDEAAATIGQVDKPELCAHKDVSTVPEADLKFPTVEVIASENVTELPPATEKIHESVVQIDAQIPEPITAVNMPSEDVSLLPEHIEQMEIKQVSYEVPRVPSDIVRYLYYGDDISFEEAAQNSFHSQSDSYYVSNLPSDEKQSLTDSSKNFETSAPATVPELWQEAEVSLSKPSSEILPEAVQDSSHLSSEEIFKLDSGSARDESIPPFDSSECIDNWFDMEKDKSLSSTNGRKVKRDSSSTKSSALKDSEQPCIPEHILSPKLEGDFGVGRVDIDEVTDISTHFTMTDDSDRFSDIESDTSLNFEDECIPPLEFYDQIEIDDHAKDDGMFESCIDEHEMDLQTPEVEEMPDAFQFILAEQQKEEFIDSTVPIEQEKFDECVTSSELSEHVKEQFAECLTSSESPKQQSSLTTQEHFDEVKDKMVEHVVSSEFSDKASCKEIVQEHVEEKLNEYFDECVTEFSEQSKERFVECLTSSKMFDQQLTEEEAFHEIAAEHLSNELKEESTSNLQLCLEDENGNFPELVVEEMVSPGTIFSTDPEVHIPSDILEKIPPAEIIECSFDDKVDEMNISCYVLPEEDSHVAESSAIHTSQGLDVSLQTGAAKHTEDNGNEIDVSTYALPDEGSHSISAEVTDNWFDVEAKNIEIVEPVYELSHEDLNIVYLDSNISSSITQESKEKSIVCEAISAKSFKSSETKVIESVESDVITFEAQREDIKLDVNVIEAAELQDTKSDVNVVTEDINNKFESEKSETSTADDSLHTVSEISETKEVSVYDEPEFDINEVIDDKQYEILTHAGALEQELKETFVSLLSSDVQNISEIKMGTESEISAALREEVNIECMSATPGSEPTSLLGKTMYDAQKVQSEEISSGELCLREEVATSFSSQPESELQITSDVVMERFQLAEDADIFDSSPLDIIKIKDIDISKIEAKELYESTFKFSELVEDDTANILEIPPVKEERDLTSVSLPCDKNGTSELPQSEEQILAKKEISVIPDVVAESGTQKVEIVNFKGEISVDSKKEISEIPDVVAESGIEKVEIVNFKGEISVDSNKETVEAKHVDISLDKTSVQKEQVDFNLEPDFVDFIGRKHQEEIKEESTDFKGQFSTYKGDQKSETPEFRSKPDDQASKVLMGKEIFHGDSTEIVDFKGCAAVTKDQTDIQVVKSSVMVREEAESKVIKQDKFFCSSDSDISSERVDFKGGFVKSCDIVNFKSEGSAENVPITDEKKLRYETGSHSSQIVDFKGQINEAITTELKNKEESVDFKGIGLVTGQLNSAQDSNIKLKMESEFETVDFKGQITSACLSETKKEEATTDTKKVEVAKQIDKLEIIDFKGIISADKQGMQQKEIDPIQQDTAAIRKNIKTEVQPENLEIDKSSETTVLRDSIYSGYSGINEQEIEYDIINTLEDNQVFYADDVVYDATFYNTGAEEIYGYDTLEQPVTLEELTHGYDLNDQIAVFEIQEQAFHDQIITANIVDYSISGETSELYSCAETLTAAEDSIQFYSLYNELEDTGITTSEDFTDVPSHLTESSDKWSDAEGDFSFEEAEFDRDKTPTRAIDESKITYPKENELKDTAFYHQESESAFKSVDVKDQSVSVLDDRKPIGTSETPSSERELKDILPEESKKFEIVSEVILEQISKYPEDEKSDFLKTVDTASQKLVTTEIDDSVSVEVKRKNIVEAATVGETLVIQTQKDAEKVIEPYIESPELKSQVVHVSQHISDDISLKTEIVNKQEEVQEVSSADSAILLQHVDEIELSSTDKSGDFSVVTSAEDYTDVSAYQLTTEGSDKWSDVGSEMEHLKRGGKIGVPDEKKQASETVSERNITDQVASSNAMNLPSGDLIKHTQVEECDMEAPLLEHFADIKSIKEQLTTADTFSSFDAETAVSKTHEDTSTDISSQFEKTESDYWLEAETEHSVSEFDEDKALSLGKDEDLKLEFAENDIIEEMAAAIPSSQLCFTEAMSTSSSSFTDFENFDQTSDTCADISLQGATTENSDKWSDIEAEALIDDVLYGNVDITENLEVLDFPQPIKQHEENAAIAESSPSDSQLRINQCSIETTTEIGILSKVDTKSKNEIEDVKVSTESTSELLKSKSESSFEGLDTTSMNLTDSGQSSMPTDSSSSLLTPSNVTSTTGMSDDELTSVTPLDVEESDKWSDISGDTSVEEIDDESSVSIKADAKLPGQVSDTVSSEFRKLEDCLVEGSQGLDVELKISEISGEETVAFTSANKEKDEITSAKFEPTNLKETNRQEIFKSDTAQSIAVKDKTIFSVDAVAPVKLESHDKSSRKFISTSEDTSASVTLSSSDSGKQSKDLSIDSTATVSGTAQSIVAKDKQFSSIEAVASVKAVPPEEKFEIDDSSSSKVTDEFETVDSYTDVPTQTLTSEISDAYCELESDHSVEEIENQYAEPEYTGGTQDIAQVTDIVTQNVSECYENYLADEELLENVDDFGLDTVPENELEVYEDEEYSLSEHFEINEDELIYPLPYNDWIEQSFELKEYGIEAAFSESGSDIHGFGIASEEYEDEDIQRAIDYNLSTLEEDEDNAENIGTTDSFKTLSNDASPRLKVSEKEFDTWSTADAPSIDEEYAEQDNVLSKIDELLAEDFNLDTYQTESPLKDDELNEDLENYMQKDIPKLEETYEALTLTDSNSLTKSTLLQIDKDYKATDSETVCSEISEKDSTVLLRANKKLEISECETVSTEFTSKKDSTQGFKAESSSSKEIPVSLDSSKAIPEEIKLSEISNGQSGTLRSVKKASMKPPDTAAGLSDERKILKSEIEEFHSSSDKVVQPIAVKDKQISSIETEASVNLETLDKNSRKILSTSEDASTSVTLSSSDSGKQSKDLSIASTVSVSDTAQSFAVKDKQISSVETEASVKLESHDKSSKKILSTSEDACASVTLSSIDSGKQSKDLSIKSTVSVSDTAQSIAVKDKQFSSIEAEASVKLESHDKSSKKIISTSEDACTSVILSSSDSDKQIKGTSTDSTELCISETHSSSDIPSKKLIKSAETSEEISLKAKTSSDSSEGTKFIQSSEQLSKSSKHSVSSAVSSAEIQSNIPDQREYETPVESVGEKHVITSEITSSDSLVVEVKPDIPKKTRQRSLDSKEGTPLKDEKPSLPPKLSKRHSVSNSPSSSLGESLSSSSSVESLGSFESAASGISRKDSSKSSDEPSMHSVSPEVPARRSRSSKVSSSSSRSESRDSDSSAPSRSSSLKIRRRSSNFREPEPIDLSKKRASIDERMQKLQNEGKCTTREKAFIAAKLIEMQFEEEDALLASRQCNSVYHAVEFLTQLCEMCNCRFPINLMSSMMHCTHRACRECLKAHFTTLIYDRSIFTLLCPICQKPDITDQNIQEYFNHLDMMLRNFLDDRVYDLFQRKLRDEVLTKDPNFHWCSQCSSGFIASPRLKKLYCPDCSAITCALCHQTWELEHEGVHCERFQQWKDMHTPEPPPAGLVKFLIDRGVSCPSCGIVYAEACGGCMMYKCSHCSFEFCGFCIRPCKRGRDCSNKSCETRGLHIHHLQNCLFYLRDKDLTEIQMLLEEESVTYLTIPPKDQIVKSRCQVREQKNNHGVLSEDRCGRGIEPYCGGLCSTHYYEYLAELLRKNSISPLSIMTIQDLQFMLRKSRILVPEKMKGEASEEYYERLLNLVSSALT